MRLSVLEMMVWTAIVAVAAAAWRVHIAAGLLATFVLILAFLSRLETVAPQYVVIGFAILVLAILVLLGSFLR